LGALDARSPSGTPTGSPRGTPTASGSDQIVALRVGLTVTAHGLLSKPELNGRSGVCESFDSLSGSWTVRFDSDKTVPKLLPKNLRVQAQV
jgi:hypothetical protein